MRSYCGRLMRLPNKPSTYWPDRVVRRRASGGGPALAMLLALTACAGEPGPLDAYGGSQFYTVAVPVNDDGLVEPQAAYEEANEHCAEYGRSAVYFQGTALGSDQRQLHFRCQ